MKILLLFIFTFSLLQASDYKNTNGKSIDKSLSELLEWRLSRDKPVLSKIEISNSWQEIINNKNTNFAIWIGHSTFLINLNGVYILTDPIFSDRASPLKNIGPKRLIEPAININEIPKVDIVTISHNHYDHLDIKSLKIIANKFPQAKFLVPVGDKKLLEKNNIDNIFEFQWWDTMSINDIDITFTPVQHWSARGIFDRNKSLWGGWYFNAHGLNLFHAGDSGYSKDFVDIKNNLGAPDLAFIPIGAYDPEWFMSESHMNPEEAVKVSLDLNAKQSIGMHWGTFTLTSEDTIDPFNRVNSLKNHNLKTIKPGEYLIF